LPHRTIPDRVTFPDVTKDAITIKRDYDSSHTLASPHVSLILHIRHTTYHIVIYRGNHSFRRHISTYTLSPVRTIPCLEAKSSPHSDKGSPSGLALSPDIQAHKLNRQLPIHTIPYHIMSVPSPAVPSPTPTTPRKVTTARSIGFAPSSATDNDWRQSPSSTPTVNGTPSGKGPGKTIGGFEKKSMKDLKDDKKDKEDKDKSMSLYSTQN
jgi:hypothetical protein